MKAKEEFIEYIDKIYLENPIKSYRKILSPIKSLGLPAIYTILELAETSHVDKKLFLFNIISELGNRKAIPLLSKILHNQLRDDDTRILALMATTRLGGKVDFDSFYATINNFEMLGRFFVLNALNEMDNPLAIEELTEQFSGITREGKISILMEFVKIKDDERILPTISAWIDRVDDELQEYIIVTFLNSRSKIAYNYLQEIIQRVKNPTIQEKAREAIFKLGRAELIPQNPELTYKFYKAFITSSDGSGSSIFVYAVKTQRNTIKMLDFIVNDTIGINDAFGLEFNQNDFKSFYEKLINENFYIIGEVDAPFLLKRIKEAENRTILKGNRLPLPYLSHRYIFNSLLPVSNNESENKFNEFAGEIKHKSHELLPRSPELYNHNEINLSWFIEFDEMPNISFELNELIEQIMNNNPQSEVLYWKIFHQIFTGEFVKLIEMRLQQYAFISFLNNNLPTAELAIAAAIELTQIIPEQHIFLKKMFDFSIEIFQNRGRNSNIEKLIQEEFPEFNEGHLKTWIQSAKNNNEDWMDEEWWGENIPELNSVSAFEAFLTDKTPLLLPKNNTMTYIEKLFFLKEKFPDTRFSRTVPRSIKGMKPKDIIRLLNFWETAHDSYLYSLIGAIDWKNLRQELGLYIDRKIIRGNFKDVEYILANRMPTRGYEDVHIDLARRLWTEYVFMNDGQVEPMNKPATWAAGLEYLVGSMIYAKDPQIELARDYGISPASVGARYRMLKDTLNLYIFNNEIQKVTEQMDELLYTIYKTLEEDV
ncbi:hypothetical protein JW964_01355 [candidate division KSB1 bacterium]|nr:hypothetical protein [candidate division KSB1 bacterium]